MSSEETYNTIVIGGGQAGLAAGYYLTQRGKNYVILDENTRTGATLTTIGSTCQCLMRRVARGISEGWYLKHRVYTSSACTSRRD